jgi:hypothetical protein
MNHKALLEAQKNGRLWASPARRLMFLRTLLIFVLALLVGNAAAGLAGGLAGSLAFAAATVLGALTEITGSNGLNSFHGIILQSLKLLPDASPARRIFTDTDIIAILLW